jgi:hypothetical protein
MAMLDTSPLHLLFRVAAGPRVGFGHLVRCRSIARALGIEPMMSVRGTPRTQLIARSMGGALVKARGVGALRWPGHDLLVLDDPSARHAERWLRRAHQLKIPVASVHDLGLGRVGSDLQFDASADPILDPSVFGARQRTRRPVPYRVLIALGGGAHVRRLAARLADAIAALVPNVQVRAACGFTTDGRAPLGCGRWIAAPDGLADELSKATVVVTAGGVTLFEACALGVPAVALALTAAQCLTIQIASHAGAAIDAGPPPMSDAVIMRAATAAASLLTDPDACRVMAAAGRRLVDARGVFRAADRLRHLRSGAAHAA